MIEKGPGFRKVRRKPDLQMYARVMSLPLALRHREYRKVLGAYVSQMSEEEKQGFLDRREDIRVAEYEWMDRNREALLKLGFTDVEAEELKDKRLGSPGMRNYLELRVFEFMGRKDGRQRKRKKASRQG